ncbi:MalY/PatB family protein [Marivita hallyeonensis]|uniref:cysteine-S-conjugate beta-lyase n=1 Tax=Marivita hallyeonensis TaxID=996342 RepID=A0A1M5XCK9_9RHOB|nr:PatB family C-S lyase [Marivita hallyeonensis]SHH97264.1 cystathione beta-lyase [Marivita hallyeonensis]
MTYQFNTMNDRRGTNCSKWDVLESKFDVPSEDGLAMWTADSDYPTAPCVLKALQDAVDHGVFGYWTDNSEYHKAIQWWMKSRHGWDIDTDWILTCQGLGNAIALCLDVWSAPGDRIVTFNPVYHEFEFKIRKAGRVPVQCPLKRDGDTYDLDLDTAQDMLDGTEKMLIFCSPQNPSGRVWSREELKQVAEFCARNDLLLISDEIHHDFIYPGHTFVPMDVAAPQIRDRLVVLTAASKTFNIAGQKTGNMIIPDDDLRAAMAQRLRSLDYSPNALGLKMVTAAYSPEGADWVDAQIAHLMENKAIFDEGVNAIPGVRSLPLQSTYLAWVDFSGTGMDFEEISRRVRKDARIAPSPGPEFGPGGETFLRFNLATQKARVVEAVHRLQTAFADLQ